MIRLTRFMTNHAARNIASDYASRHMRKARRKRWNDEDRAICIAKYDALATARMNGRSLSEWKAKINWLLTARKQQRRNR
jgi:hypothetical protein